MSLTGTKAPQDDGPKLQQLAEQLSEAAKGYTPGPGAAGYESRANVTHIAKEIVRLMMAPNHMAMQHATNGLEIVAVRTMLGLGVLKAIPLEGSISLADLSKATNVQDSLLERMLRLLVGTGFIDQTPDYEYVHTKFSRAYIPSPGPGNFFQFINDECLSTMLHFHQYIKDRGETPVHEPDDPLRNPYTHRHNQDGLPVWAVMAQFPERFKTFQLGLMAQEDSAPITGFYDFSALYNPDTDGDRTTLIDLGGGQGQSIIEILSNFPSLRADKFILQDLPEPIAHVKETKSLPEGVTAMVHDFWTPQPIKGAKAYFFRRIMHDYSDENCTKILARVRDAMEPDSKVLIADMVMPKRVGEADLPAAAMDNCVMVMGGKERTEDGFRKILEDAGLKLHKVWRSREGGAAGNIVEARLKD
ncbi:S-adenosyl-L-methionine-dependent methyltransferase [Exophiala viscosa]|uniref:S-adenosyl-L-methionine-dependent methyltransferase n=1 Tax=Exophiala viscosa TaxID=2486360 RepID=A0AAN6DYY5_9EURO|nr:S-adenosyl-L-methionine-dependent methyltransferase [Exophiala viscosa]